MKQVPDKIYEKFVLRLKPVMSVLNKTKKVIVGVSGGPDSMFLLFLFTKFTLKHKIELIPVYINHRVRTEKEIKKDIETVKTFCEQNGLGLTVAQIKTKKMDENTLRELRYKKLLSIAKKLNCKIIATGHTLDDVVETFFLNLLRGSGIKGLCSIPAIRQAEFDKDLFYIVRPIIDISKEDILKVLHKQKIGYVVDKTNLGVFYKRNLLRNKILPLFRQINPNFKKKVLSFIVLFNQFYETLSTIIDEKIKKITKQHRSSLYIDLTKFLMYNNFIKQEILYRIVSLLSTKHKIKLRQGYYDTVNKILQFTSSGKLASLQLTKRLKLNKTKNYLVISTK